MLAGVGNLGFLRSGRSVFVCSANSVPQTVRKPTAGPETTAAIGASIACMTRTTMVAASAASTVATMVGVLTRKWIRNCRWLGLSSM